MIPLKGLVVDFDVLNPSKGVRVLPFYCQPSVDVVVIDDLEYQRVRYKAGRRLTSNGQRLVLQNPLKAIYNDLRYYVWRVRHFSSEGKKAILFARASEISLFNGEPDGLLWRTKGLTFGSS